MASKSKELYILEYGEEEGLKKYEINKRKGVTLENMTIKYGEEEGHIKYNAYIEKIHNTRGYSYYLKTHPAATLEEYKQLFNTVSLESFIKRYGDEEGEKRYNEYVIKNRESVNKSKLKFIDEYGMEAYKKKHTLNLEHFVKKYGEEEGSKKWDSYREKLSFANSLNGYISRYGLENGTNKWNEYILKLRNSNKWGSEHFKYINSIKYYIDTYGYEEGQQKYEQYKKKLDRCSLNYFLTKYKDENIAYEHYKKSCTKHASKNNAYYSLISQELFYNLHKYILLFDKNPDIQYATYNGEFSICDRDFSIKFYDFRYKNILIEFNGDYWHGNPNIYRECDIVHHNIIAKDLWENDKIKKNIAIKNNNKILYIWESEYNKDKVLTINKILEFIKNNLE